MRLTTLAFFLLAGLWLTPVPALAQEDPFDLFERICLATEGQEDRALAAAGAAGFEPQGVADPNQRPEIGTLMYGRLGGREVVFTLMDVTGGAGVAAQACALRVEGAFPQLESRVRAWAGDATADNDAGVLTFHYRWKAGEGRLPLNATSTAQADTQLAAGEMRSLAMIHRDGLTVLMNTINRPVPGPALNTLSTAQVFLDVCAATKADPAAIRPAAAALGFGALPERPKPEGALEWEYLSRLWGDEGLILGFGRMRRNANTTSQDCMILSAGRPLEADRVRAWLNMTPMSRTDVSETYGFEETPQGRRAFGPDMELMLVMAGLRGAAYQVMIRNNALAFSRLTITP